MERTRWSVLIALLMLFSAPAAHAQRVAKYTELPEYFRDELALREQAEWLRAAWENPTEVMEAQIEKLTAWNKAGRPEDHENTRKIPEAIRYLDFQDYEISRRAIQGDSSIRTILAERLTELARWDPVFEAVLEIASPSNTERIDVIQSLQLLVDALNNLEGDYPAGFAAARDILMERRDDEGEVRFVVIKGVLALPEACRTDEMTSWLIDLLESNEQIIVEKAARALGEIGAVEAVRPLMEKFVSLPEGEDPPTPEGEERVAEPINQARLAIALTVSRMTNQQLALTRQMDKTGLMAQYQELLAWWEANKGSFN